MFSRFLYVWAVWSAFASLLAGANLPAAESDRSAVLAEKDKLDRQFAEQLAGLATRCQQLGLEEPARQTRVWIIRRDPSRTYLFDPAATDPLRPDASQPVLVQQWYAKLTEYRKAQAAALFELARRAAADHPTLAFRWLHEVLREDPDHAESRRILGYRHGGSGWQRPERVTRVRQATTVHPQLAWPARTYWWIESQHFRVATNHSAEAGTELSLTLEKLYDAWQQVLFSVWAREGSLVHKFNGSEVSLGSSRRHNVVLFRDRDNYVQQLSAVEPRIAVSLGYYLDRMSTAFFYAGDPSVKATWLHEATHQLFQERAGVATEVGMNYNFWATEGVALYMESLRDHGGYLTVGGFDADRLQFARYRALNERFVIPVEKLVLYGREALQQDEDIRRIYTQAAGLAHFLLDYDQGRYAAAFRDYLVEIYVGRDAVDTLPSLTNASWDTLNAQYLEYLNVTDEDLQYFDDDVQLQNLCLGHTSVTVAGLQQLAGQRELEWLDLAYTATSDAGLKVFAHAAKLRQLNLEHTQITDQSLPTLLSFRQLEELDLSGTPLTDAALAQLAALDQLKVLWLTSTKLTDVGLEALAALQQLEMLDVSHTSVTPPAWQRIKQQLPKLEHE